MAWLDNKGYSKDSIPSTVLSEIIQTKGPTEFIASIDEVKNYLKIGSDNTDDALINDLIKTATRIIEHECGGLVIYKQTFEQYTTGGCKVIKLLRQPIIGTPTVSYSEDFDSTATNLVYLTDFRKVNNVLYHSDGYFKKGRDGDGYKITFDAGIFQDGSHSSSTRQETNDLRIAIYRTIAFLYENREEYLTQIKEGQWSVAYDNKFPIGIKLLIMQFHTGNGLI
jgi:hypothetical protein